MQIQFIFNEGDVKNLAPISRNIAGEYISAAMFEAQEIGLKQIIGSNMLHALKAAEIARNWPAPLASLKEAALPFLVYRTIVALIPKVSTKIANIGVYQSTDEKVAPVRKEDVDSLIESYQANADYFAHELQVFIVDHLADYAAIDAGQCSCIEANLRSMASCGIWLGGPRGIEL